MVTPPRGPLFVTDQNFPQPILKEALKTYIPEIRIEALWEFDSRLTRDHEDWEVILALKQLGAEGFVSCDDNMLDNPKVIALIEQTKFSVVSCQKTGHDPIVASGLLLTHLPHIAKRHDADRPLIWRLSVTEQRPLKLSTIKEAIQSKSGTRVDDYRISQAALYEPLLPPSP